MRIRLIREADGPNPAYDAKHAASAEAAGGLYDVPHTITLPVGTELEDRHAWMHCVPGHRNQPPIAEPVDDAARAKVARWLKARALTIEWLLALNPKNLNGESGEHLKELQKVYGTDHESGAVLSSGGDQSGAEGDDAERDGDVRPVAKRSRTK